MTEHLSEVPRGGNLSCLISDVGNTLRKIQMLTGFNLVTRSAAQSRFLSPDTSQTIGLHQSSSSTLWWKTGDLSRDTPRGLPPRALPPTTSPSNHKLKTPMMDASRPEELAVTLGRDNGGLLWTESERFIHHARTKSGYLERQKAALPISRTPGSVAQNKGTHVCFLSGRFRATDTAPHQT